MGRPPIQHHKIVHTLDIDPDVLDAVREIVTIQAVGRASAGFLGNPANGALILGAILGISGGLLGVEGAEVIGNFINRLRNLHEAEPGSPEQSVAVNAFINAQRALIEFFAPFLKGSLP